MANTSIKMLFLDVGGVLLTNGWDRSLRDKAAEVFNVKKDEMDERHHLVFDTYETGKITFDDYLKQVVFYKPRSFSIEKFKSFIFDAARSYPETINYLKQLKKEHHLRVGMISNEGRELAIDRINRFKLGELFDFFIVSSFVHLRKPDPEIYRLALDMAQVPPKQIAYLDDRGLFVEVAKSFGIHGIHHTSLDQTKSQFNLLVPVPVVQ